MKHMLVSAIAILGLAISASAADEVAPFDAKAARSASQELFGALDFLGSTSKVVSNPEAARTLDEDVGRLRELVQQLSAALDSGQGRSETQALFGQIVAQGESIRRSMGTVHIAPTDERLERYQRAMTVLSWSYRTP
jgi:hypothetical protein